MFTTYLQNKIKNEFLHKNYLGVLKLSKQKKFCKFSIFFSLQCTGCAMRQSAEISRRSENIQALLKIGKNECNYSYALSSKGKTFPRFTRASYLNEFFKIKPILLLRFGGHTKTLFWRHVKL
jgi:hypothetical protein